MAMNRQTTTNRSASAGTRKKEALVKVNLREKVVVLAIRGVLMRDKKALYRIARAEGLNSLSALLRREIKRLIRGHRRAA